MSEPVHMIIDVRADRGKRIVTTRCGAKRIVGMNEPLADAGLTGWQSLVTCPDCG